MIIAGNSQVSMFWNRKILSETTRKRVSVHWVGALTIDQFFKKHPSAQLIRQLFSNTDEWKFLSIGLHDYKILMGAYANFSHGQFQLFLNQMICRYQKVFVELNSKGRFAWLIAPQQRVNLETYGLNERDIVKCYVLLNDYLIGWCRINQIKMLNPLKNIVHPNGRTRKEYLTTDGYHLNFKAAEQYLQIIESLTGEKLIVETKTIYCQNIIKPSTKTEYMILPLSEKMDLPWDQTKVPFGKKNYFANQILFFVSNLLKQKDINLNISKHTDYISAGKFNSIELINIYTYATDLIGLDLNFDVYIRHLNTVEKMASFLLINKPFSINDLFNSAISNITDEYNPTEIMFADYRIASMNDTLHQKVKSFFNTNKNEYDAYGVFVFWLSLIESHHKNYNLALEYLQKARDKILLHPFESNRMDYYQSCWTRKLTGFEPLLEILRHKQL